MMTNKTVENAILFVIVDMKMVSESNNVEDLMLLVKKAVG
jgi:hypothetical protein